MRNGAYTDVMDVIENHRSKAALRRACVRLRKNLDPRYVQQAAADVRVHVLGLQEFLSAELVHVYLSSLPNELDTHGLIADGWARGKRIVVPVMNPDSRELRHAFITPEDRLERDRWGLLGPGRENACWLADLGTIDLILVPGVAFDRHGNRLGMGGGYYDRFLAGVSAPRVGLTYSEFLLDELPVQCHDVPMDLVVCPRGIIRCRDR